MLAAVHDDRPLEARVGAMTRDSDKWPGNGVYYERPGMARDGYEDTVPRTREGIDALPARMMRELEWRRFRCDELPVKR